MRSFKTPFGSKPTRDEQISNLKTLENKKRLKLDLLLRRAGKLGQIRAYEQAGYLLHKEIEKEQKDLVIIMEELNQLTA